MRARTIRALRLSHTNGPLIKLNDAISTHLDYIRPYWNFSISHGTVYRFDAMWFGYDNITTGELNGLLFGAAMTRYAETTVVGHGDASTSLFASLRDGS